MNKSTETIIEGWWDIEAEYGFIEMDIIDGTGMI